MRFAAAELLISSDRCTRVRAGTVRSPKTSVVETTVFDSVGRRRDVLVSERPVEGSPTAAPTLPRTHRPRLRIFRLYGNVRGRFRRT